MFNQKLSWNISMNMTHQNLLCGKMKLKRALGWLTSDANKPKCQNNAEVISPTVSWGSDLQYFLGLHLLYSCHMRFYFWMKAALIKRFNCLSVCLMVKLLHLLHVWISLPVQSIGRRCLISEGLVMKAHQACFLFPHSPGGSNRLLIFHPQTDQTWLNLDISCPWTSIPHFHELSAQSRPFSQPINSQVASAVGNVFEDYAKFEFFVTSSSKRDSIPIIIFFLFSIWIKLSFPNNYTWKEVLTFERLIVLSADKP